MKIRLVPQSDGQPSVAVRTPQGWLPLRPLLTRRERLASPELESAAQGVLPFLQIHKTQGEAIQALIAAASPDDYLPDPPSLLPVQPRAFRDFMLYEQHYINAARGMAQRFLPEKVKMLELYEKVFKKPHAKLLPKPIWYKKPIYYMGSHINFYTDGDKVPWPAYTNALDYELELGVIVAHPIFNASPDEAREAIGGFVIINDFSARDVQLPEMGSGFGPVKSKNFANAMSSVVVTADELFPRVDALAVRVIVNGETWGEGSTAGMQFSLGEMVAYASLGEHVVPGEVMATGTIPGCSGVETGHWLSHGDEITLEIEGIGHLVNVLE